MQIRLVIDRKIDGNLFRGPWYEIVLKIRKMS